MENFWQVNKDGSYTFLANGKNYGKFESSSSNKSSSTNFTIEKNNYSILRQGFWKTNIVILDNTGKEVLSVKSLKWYGNEYGIHYNNKKYVLKIGNNPLSEWSIYEDSVLQLAYALSTSSGKPGLKITGLLNVPVLFHFLLWYLIRPIIIESTGQDSDVMVMTTLMSNS